MLDRTPVVDTLIHECTPATERADIMRDTTPEEVAACESNLEAAWGKYAVPTPATDRRDVLVCHGNVIRWIVTRALGADRLHWLRMDIANASITVIAIRADGSVKLATFSDTGHMQPDGQSWTGRGAGWGEAKEK
jgi:serine/threonine-protein phosphatase PGAM5